LTIGKYDTYRTASQLLADRQVSRLQAQHCGKEITPVASTIPNDAQQERDQARHRAVMAVLPALLVTMLLAFLDNMIVSTALPRIVGDLGGLDHLAWVITAYILTMTVSTPLYGKLGDLYGRKRLFVFAIVVFLIGSMLCGMATSMPQLIGFRALQGLGAGGLMVGVLAIIGDLVSPRDRGKYQGYFAGLMAVATIGGPLIGGFITDNLSWRWAFYVNIPLGILSLALVLARLQLPFVRRPHRVDWSGAALLTVAISAVILLTTWGGKDYAWDSPMIIGLGLLTVVTATAFVLVERRVEEPILPLTLFANRNFSVSSAMGFFVGFSMFGATAFLPLYQQTVQGASATNSGLLLLPLMLGVMSMSVVSGQVISRTGHYRAFPIIGGAAMIVGMVLLAQLDASTSMLRSSVFMLILGLGMGFVMQVTMLLPQNSVEARDMGVASSTSMFTRSIGGAFGVAIFGAIFSTQLTAGLDRAGAAGLAGGAGQIDPATLGSLQPSVLDGVLQAIAGATSTVFGWAAISAVAVFLLSLLIKAVPLRGNDDAPPVATPEPVLETAT
jgi:EmrB/QacA subfamily drug resistance transporter